MPHPHRVRCSPLQRKERVVDVVETIVRADGQRFYAVDVDGHRFRVLAADAVPV